MGALLARCRIGCQIAALGFVGVLGVLCVVVLNAWGDARIEHAESIVSAARQANEIQHDVHLQLLEARRHEKNFILRRNEPSIAGHAKAMTAVHHDLADLLTRTASQPELRARVDQIAGGITRYGTAFDALVKSARTTGLTYTDGLRGQFYKAVHAVETILKTVDVPNAQIAMLMMRRHEKDFLAREDTRYGAEVKARLPEFVAALDAANVTGSVRADLMANMTLYQDAFARLMEGTLAEKAAEKALIAAYQEVRLLLEELDQTFSAQAAVAAEGATELHDSVHRTVYALVLVIIAVVVLLCWLIGRGIAGPIVRVTRVMEALVAGKLDVPVPTDSRRDEIGTMVLAVQGFKDSLIATERLRQEQATLRDQAEADKRAALTGMADRIETDAGAGVRAIGERTAAMTTTAGEMRSLAERTGNAARGAAGAAALALGNAQTVASAAEELSASIREISSQVTQSTTVVGQAVAAGTETRATIETLNDRVARIGDVADMIGAIAAKTNLLALNATIEAARAGEAGKGFAVVASEVKQLASQTARSTEEITRHIAEVRLATAEAVTAVSRIESTIGQVNAIAGSIAAAVEEQGAATAEIARNVTETASAVNEMNSRNADVSNEADQAGRYAEDVLDSTRVLDGAISDLRRAVVRTVRTSTAEVDRRRMARIEADLPCQVELAGKGVRMARVVDISVGGARLVGLTDAEAGMTGTLRMAGLASPLPFRVVALDGDAARLKFEPDEATRTALHALVERLSQAVAA